MKITIIGAGAMGGAMAEGLLQSEKFTPSDITVSDHNQPCLLYTSMVKVGILGAAGYTGGELIRLLINHPEAEIVFANSESNAGNLVAEGHEGLYGETDLKFTAEMPFDQVDVIFFCKFI